MDERQCFRREQPALGARRYLQTVLDVGGGVLEVQRLQVTSNGNALLHRHHGRSRQLLLESRLSGENDLDQLPPRGLEIGQVAQLFELLHGKPLRLVDEENNRSAGLSLARQGLPKKKRQGL